MARSKIYNKSISIGCSIFCVGYEIYTYCPQKVGDIGHKKSKN